MQNYVKPHISTNKAEADDQTKMGKQCEWQGIMDTLLPLDAITV
jgi:hypothetical protein